jgi:hypothetical protein
MIMDKGHERNDSKRAVLLSTILLIESVENCLLRDGLHPDVYCMIAWNFQ